MTLPVFLNMRARPERAGGVPPVAAPTTYLETIQLDNPTFVYPMNDLSGGAVSAIGGPPLVDPGGAQSPAYQQTGPNLLGVTPNYACFFHDQNTEYLYYDGVDNDAFDLNQGNFTIEAWVNYLHDDPRERNIVRIDYGTSSYFLLRTTFSNTWGGGGGAIASGAVTSSFAGWTHLAFVRTGTSGQLYVNGVADGAAVGGQADGVGDPTPLHVGLGPGGASGTRFHGDICWIAGYKTALSAARLLAHATAINP
jgi:hypothetical protein